MNKFNPFHLVTPSPWPLTTSLRVITFALGVILITNRYSCWAFILSILTILFSSYLWRRDIHRESCLEGSHNRQVITGIKVGIIFFIISECFFFLGIFWAYIHLGVRPATELAILWPPVRIEPLNPKGIPFLNTIVLVSSGISVTWAHHCIEKGEFKRTIIAILTTILLAAFFTALQVREYRIARFSIADSSYGSIFFIGTGFHGLHVIIGTVLLSISTLRFIILRISPNHRVGFECSVWYWHFVDIVWFLLYLIFYWWGS